MRFFGAKFTAAPLIVAKGWGGMISFTARAPLPLFLLLMLPLLPAAHPSMGWATVPLFAHVRWANFTPADLHQLSRFRSVTIQVAPAAPLPCEAQAADVQTRLAALGAAAPPVFMYGNVRFAEPNCAYFEEVAHSPWLWLNDSTGAPVKPGGRFTWDWSVPGVPAWWAQRVIMAPRVAGGFGDSGCGEGGPAWFNASRAAAFAQGQREAHALATALLANASAGTYIANCPVLPHNGDPPIPGVNGQMLESWCSDFQPKGAGPAAWCRAELVEAVLLGAAGAPQAFLQARYYLNGKNGGNPQFGLAAFLVAAFPGAFFGASVDWDFAGDWEKLLAWPWAAHPLGAPAGPPTMGDPSGCAWTRAYANATAQVNVCAKHLFARISWGAAAAAGEAAGEGGGGVGEVLPMPPLGARDGVRVREAGVGEACRAGVEAEVGAPWAATGSGRACLSRVGKAA